MKSAIIRARVPETLKTEFETAIEARGWNLSQAIRQLMNQYVMQEKEKTRWKEETLEALADIEADKIIDGEQVMAWLDTWGSDNETDPPL